jgi:hypothetical protein
MKLKEIIPSYRDLMGVKAVYGRSPGPEGVMAFGSHGNDPNERSYYSHGESVARRALTTPYFITIGGGERVLPEYDGRVLALVRASPVYGRTEAFVRMEETRKRLEQWPVAIIITEMYTIEGEPLLVEDLGFPDKSILANAFDGVRFVDEQMNLLWERLHEYEVTPRRDISPPPRFYDPGKLTLAWSQYPTISAREGDVRWETTKKLERSSKAAKAAKDRNNASNGGRYVCEGCGLADETRSLFDAHHLHPLAAGPRLSTIDSYAVLCVLCHRWAHYKSTDPLVPLTVPELQSVRTGKVKA